MNIADLSNLDSSGSAPAPATSRRTLLSGAALGMALLDAASLQAKTNGAKEQAEALRAAMDSRQGSASKAVEIPAGDAYQVGRSLLAAGDNTGAMGAFRKALLENPKSADAMNGLGVVYDRMGRYDVSRNWYEAALAITPNAGLLLNNLGYSLFLQGELRAAIPHLQQASRSGDRAVVATSQRLLAMIAARLTAQAAAAPLAPQLASGSQSAMLTLATPQMALAQPARSAAAVQVASLVEAPRALPARVVAPAVVMAAAQPARAPQPLAAQPARPAASQAIFAAAPAPAIAPVATAQARIEITASGEQQLVLGGEAPAATLVASLGEAATMVLVARPSPTIEAPAIEIARAEPLPVVVTLAALEAEQATAFKRDEMVAAIPGQPAILEQRRSQVAVQASLPAREEQRQQPRAATQILARAAAPDETPAAALAAALPADTAPPAAFGWNADIAYDVDVSASAWLLASRRDVADQTCLAAPVLAEAGEPGFDSDDAVLNRFALRMRGLQADDARFDEETARLAAVTRLELLLDRVRARTFSA